MGLRSVCGICDTPIAADGCCDCDEPDTRLDYCTNDAELKRRAMRIRPISFDSVEMQTFGPLAEPPIPTTLPTDSAARKEVPLASGVLAYFPAALAGVARISKQGNDKHNAGQPLHHARGKSADHADCVVRHLMDLQDLLANAQRIDGVTFNQRRRILEEASCLAWRALALSQELHERIDGAPLAPGAR